VVLGRLSQICERRIRPVAGFDREAGVGIRADDEGTPCRGVAIIQNCVLKDFSHIVMSLQPIQRRLANVAMEEDNRTYLRACEPKAKNNNRYRKQRRFRPVLIVRR
jgi:hypothetical protein